MQGVQRVRGGAETAHGQPLDEPHVRGVQQGHVLPVQAEEAHGGPPRRRRRREGEQGGGGAGGGGRGQGRQYKVDKVGTVG